MCSWLNTTREFSAGELLAEVPAGEGTLKGRKFYPAVTTSAKSR
jgi:hypothetical protein